ncbi:Vitamin B12 transporter BtuB (plasmid) [Asticcacaulis sp. MM231]
MMSTLHRQRMGLMVGVSVVSLIGFPVSAAYAQAAANTDGVTEVVVTGVAKGTNKLNTSTSVSSLQVDEIQKFAPRSAAEVFRNVPGIRSESTGGEGNANIAVRGLPVAAGGAKFLQIHEDGLPVLEFGDIAFANADIFLRTDLNIARVEAIRGGTASTLASNSPGGIINILSKTGTTEGGTLAVTQGLDFGQTRGDFEYGGKLAEGWRFHVGGFYRSGEGPRETGYTANKGGQIKANATRDFSNGYVTVGLKYLNDKAAGYLPMPMQVTGTNGDPNWSSAPGLNIRSGSILSKNMLADKGLDGQNRYHVTDMRNGMHPDSLVFNTELNVDLAGGWTINDKFRVARTKGDFASLFPAEVGTASAIATSAGGTSLVVANGSGVGSAYTGLAMRVHTFNVILNNLDNATNDLRLMNSFDVAGSKLNLTMGLYNSTQTINMDWVWNTYLMELSGDNARLLNAYNGTTNLSQDGLLAYGQPLWGNCCTRHYDTKYDIAAPYAIVSAAWDKLTLEASLRYDHGTAKGSYAGNTQRANFDVNGDGVISGPEQSVTVIDYANSKPVDYSWNYLSYSLGANYRLDESLSVFARASSGARVNADRLLFGKVNADGSVSREDAIDFVKQYEAGIKYRANGIGLYVTAFKAETEEQNYEATTQRFIDRLYEAKGVELEASYRRGRFSVNGGATYTDAKIVRDPLNPTQVGNTPRRQAKWVYQLTPTYKIGKADLGANFVGTTKAYTSDDNQLVMPAYVQTNLFVDYALTDKLSLSLNVNNAFDVVGITEAEEGSITNNAVNYIRARAINGRTSTATLKYKF